MPCTASSLTLIRSSGVSIDICPAGASSSVMNVVCGSTSAMALHAPDYHGLNMLVRGATQDGVEDARGDRQLVAWKIAPEAFGERLGVCDQPGVEVVPGRG